MRGPGFDPWVRKLPWRSEWQPTPVLLLPGKSHGWRSVVGDSPWDHKELDMTEQLHFILVTHLIPFQTAEGENTPVRAFQCPGQG